MASKKNSAQSKPDYTSLVPAVEQASRILLTLAQEHSGKMTLTEVCALAGIHKSKGYSILNTLQRFAFVQRSADSKTYSLGPGLLFLASKVLDHLDIREAVGPVLLRLSVETNSTAFLGLISDRNLIVVAKDEGIQDIGVTMRLGHRFPLAWGAHGKAILAFLPEAQRQELIEGSKLYVHGSPSKFDPDRLELEITECREMGYAMDLGDMKLGVHAVASPVFGPGGRLIGALAVLGTFPREMAGKHGAQVAGAAQAFSESIAGIPQGTSAQNENP